MRLLFIILGVTVLLLSPFGIAIAQDDDSFRVIEQRDTTGDGRPNVTIIAGDFATGDDEIRVYDGGNDMTPGEDWHQVTDFHNDTWVFDAAGDGNAQLIIRFEKQEAVTRAEVFSDVTGDATVAFVAEAGNIRIRETPFPTIVAEVQGDWLLPSGDLNWNIEFYTDGPTLAEPYSDINDVVTVQTAAWNSLMLLDGQPDVHIRFYDENIDGVPELGIWRLLTETPLDSSATRSFLWGNTNLDVPEQVDEAILWPFLMTAENLLGDNRGFGDNTGLLRTERPYFTTPPALLIDWEQAHLSPPLLVGYPIEDGFHVNTFSSLEDGVVNYANFEVIQAYYDLAQDNDEVAELHIRHRYFGANDRQAWNLNAPLNEIRLSWNQDNDPGATWDYKLGLAGRQSLQSEVEFPEFSIHAVPYQELPAWVNNQAWDQISFVAVEREPYFSTEGIYQWAPVERVIDNDPSAMSRYLAGHIVTDPAEGFRDIEAGLRGEIALEVDQHPRLYFSPLDERLHLLHADFGVWNIDNTTRIEYKNLDGDAYLDQWSLVQSGIINQQVIHTDPYLILGTEERVVIQRSDVPQSTFQAPPPVDHETWVALQAALADVVPTTDFEQMLAQAGGTPWMIQNARMHDFRLTNDGFRFVVELLDDFVWEPAPLDNASVLPNEPGFYVLEYSSERQWFFVQAITGPDIVVAPVAIDNQVLNALQPVRTDIIIENRGLQDATDSLLQFYIETDGDRSLLNERLIDLAAGEAQTIPVIWTPTAEGEWILHVEVESGVPVWDTEVYPATSATRSFQAAPPSNLPPSDFLSLGGQQPQRGVYLVIFLLGISVAGLTLFLLVMVNRNRADTAWQLYFLLGMITFAMGMYGYATLRFVGNWNESDTSTITRVVFAAVEQNTIMDASLAYNNGFAYTAISIFLMEISGVSLQDLQVFVYPMLTALLPLIAFVAYYALTRNATIAALATLFVYLQPDFIWVTWRGSHEKITWMFTLLLLALLVRSFGARRRWTWLLRYMVLFYFIVFALITTNVFFATSFITALGLSFAAASILLGINKWRAAASVSVDFRRHVDRLLYVSVSSALLMYVFIFHTYEPALTSISALNALADQLSAIFLNVETEASNPYEYVGTTWLSTDIFIVLTLFNWLALATSAIVWIAGVLNFLRKRRSLDDQHLPYAMLWVVYPAFVVQFIASTIADRADVLGGNLQVRLFTPVMLLAILLVAIGCMSVLERLRKPLPSLALAAGAVAVGWFSIAAPLKATNEPLLSNKWIFTAEPEIAAGIWVKDHTDGSIIWAGGDERLTAAMYFYYPELISSTVQFQGFVPSPETQYYIRSALEDARLTRQGQPEFYWGDENRVYDNGQVQIYHRRPRTIYQQ